jgi:ketosteroid isomerase-like protein
MSVQEIRSLTEQFAAPFNKKDLRTVLSMLSDNLEVFEHVPYRFDNKQLVRRVSDDCD